MVILRKYNTATASGTHIRVPIAKAGSTDFATGSDWTPASGDVKLSKDGGTQANIGTLPSYSNGAWEFQLTGTELSCKQLEIMVVDGATKAIVDQAVLIATFGNASAMYQADLSAAALAADVTKWSGTTVATPDTAGYPKTTIKSGTGTGELSLTSGAVTLTTAAAQAIWDKLTSALTTVGSIGKLLVDNIDAAISSVGGGSAPTAAAIADEIETRDLTVGTLQTAAVEAIADGLMTRAQSNWETAATAADGCLGQELMAARHSDTTTNPGYLTVFNTAGSAAFKQLLDTNSSALPIQGVDAPEAP